MKTNKKKGIKEKDLEQDDLTEVSFARHELSRVYAVGLTFENVDFKQSIISECYFRKCTFTNCDFTGALIRSTNMQGSEFSGCKFLYAAFTQTEIGIDPLSRNLPSEENLKQRLAQSLRMNYASLGHYEGVNFAIRVELAATMEHLKKAAFSRESYYRNKDEYRGLGRLRYIAKFLTFWLLDKLWGNGEQPARMFISVPAILLFIAFLISFGSRQNLGAIILATVETFVIDGDPAAFAVGWVITITLLRYVVLGLFVSSLVKRLSRR